MRTVVICSRRSCVGLLLSGCASNEKLFAQYDQEFCAAHPHSVASERLPVHGGVATDQVTIVEASGAALPGWVPVVQFEKNAAVLSDASAKLLEENTEILQRFPNYQLSVRGYVHGRADNGMAQTLITRRMDGIVEFFQHKGIGQNRIYRKVYDESVSTVESSLEKNDEVNSRVEMILLDQYGRPAVLYQKLLPFATE